MTVRLKKSRELLRKVVNDVISSAFYFLLNMSIVATFIGVVLLFLRTIKRIPRNIVYLLWSLVFVRLVIPFAIPSKASVLNLSRHLIKKVIILPLSEPDNFHISLSNYVGAAERYYPIMYRSDNLKAVFEAAVLVWIAGVVMAVLTAIVLYSLSASEFRRAWKLKDNIYVSDKVDSPIVFGIFRQRVIIPSGIDETSSDLKYILLHEQVHMKRFDNLIRLVAIFTACLHWFNPFIWMFLKLFLNDMEITCDLKATSILSKEEKKKYAQALVNMSSGQRVFLSVAFGKNIVRTRVLNVLRYERLSMFATVILTFFVLAIVVALMTNPII